MTNDRHEVAGLVSRLYALIDEGRYDELGSVYARDVELELPTGSLRGLENIVTVARQRFGRYERVQHVSSDVLVELEDDAASIRANHLAYHLHAGGRFDAGIVQRFEAARTPDGWRLTKGRADVIWRTGVDAPS